VRERTFCFGSHRGLVGVLAEPDGGARRDLPALLLFNVGLGHRVGPGRLHVNLARRLADRGGTTLRFDLSGLGDSEPRDDARADAERAVLDLREAMDLVERRTGIGSFVVAGLCSGTDGAHDVAKADPRVLGAVFIDGYAYVTPSYRARRALDKVARWASPAHWARRLQARVRRRLSAGDPETRVREPIFDRTYPPLESFRRDVEELLRRGVRLLYLYTAEAWFLDRREQFAEFMGWRSLPPGVSVEHWRDADHIFRAAAVQERLVHFLVDWVERGFIPSAADREGRSAG